MDAHNGRFGMSRRSVLQSLGIAGSTFALSVGTAAGKLPTRANETEIEIHENITFAERPSVDHESHCKGRLRLDLYLPQQCDSSSVPVLVYIHGGMWMLGTKTADQEVFEHFARQGFAVASIEYRFISEALFPAQIQDVNAAIKWLRAHADEYGLDEGNIGVWGVSAGGHLAALAGVTNDVDEFTEESRYADYSSDVQSAVSWYGIMALHEMVETAPPDSEMPYEQADSPESMLVGEIIAENPEAGKYASPIEYIEPDDPPLLLYHGNEDDLVGYGQSELMYERALDVCHDTTYYELDGLGHSSEAVYSALSDGSPATGIARTVDCCPSHNAPQEELQEGPVASIDDMEQFFRRTLGY